MRGERMIMITEIEMMPWVYVCVCVCICVCADEKKMDWMGEERDKRESAIVKAASYHIITAAISLTALMAKQWLEGDK